MVEIGNVKEVIKDYIVKQYCVTVKGNYLRIVPFFIYLILIWTNLLM